MSPDDPRHGTYAGAVAHWLGGGRPCDACAAEEWRYRKRRKLRHLNGEAPMVTAVGTLRRFRALMALGYTGPEIAAEVGVSLNSLRSLDYHGCQTVRADTARKMVSAYDRMSMTLPEGRYANRTRLMAQRRGWPPPLAWDNPDNPNETPTGWQYRPADRADILADLLERDAGISEALRVLGVSYDALEKWCERHDRGIWRRLLDNENPHRGGNQHREAS